MDYGLERWINGPAWGHNVVDAVMVAAASWRWNRLVDLTKLDVRTRTEAAQEFAGLSAAHQDREPAAPG
jgi:hypothetical protein